MHICCRSLRGERGLKYRGRRARLTALRRSLRGERGLKYFSHPLYLIVTLSLPARGAWIEIRVQNAT